MAKGQISDKNTRIAVTISKDIKVQIEKIACKENRSLSNLIVTLIKNYIDDHNKSDTE